MFLDRIYSFRFSYDKPQKICILNNKINTYVANLVLPLYYLLVKPWRNSVVNHNIIISLTTYPPRMKQAIQCLNSLMHQTVRPHKIILWLASSDYHSINDLPKNLKKLINAGLEIRFCDDIKSYKKVYFTAREFNNYKIVLADDDFYYPETWLEELVETSIKEPNCVVCHRSHLIEIENGQLKPYGKWGWYANGIKGPSYSLHILTGAGTLFPEYFFQDDFFDLNTICSIAPTVDDMWIKVYSLRKEYKVVKVRAVSKSLITVRESQKVSLISQNQSDGNDKALLALLNKYNLDIVSIIGNEE